jgi:hypothetical protein
MENYSTTEPKVKKRDIIRLTINIIPIYFNVEEIKDGIPQISVILYFNNNVMNTEYQDCAIAPLRENQEYRIVKPLNILIPKKTFLNK